MPGIFCLLLFVSFSLAILCLTMYLHNGSLHKTMQERRRDSQAELQAVVEAQIRRERSLVQEIAESKSSAPKYIPVTVTKPLNSFYKQDYIPEIPKHDAQRQETR